MKYHSFQYVLVTAAVVSAQSIADLPSCSLSCFASGVGETSCSATDYACQCTTENSAKIKQLVTACLPTSSCSISDLQTIQSFSNSFCPNVLAGKPSTTSSGTESEPTADSPSSTPTSSPPSSSSSSSSSSPHTTSSSAATPISSTFGAGTEGTAWGNLQLSTSDANRGPAFEAVSIILLAIAAMVLAFRFFARFYTHSMRQVIQSIGPDELFAVIALLCTAGVTATIIVGTKYGFGRHWTAHTTGADLVATMKLVYTFVILITGSFGTLKLSILFLYRRMTPERSHRIVIHIFMAVVVCHGTSALFGGIFQCTPISTFWELGNPLQNPRCINILAFDTFNSAWSVTEDIILWALPIPVVWGLKVPFSRKSGLYMLIAISFIAVICAIVRMASLIVWIRSPDISWNYPLIPFLANMEACVALMTSSVPAIYPLFRRPERRTEFSNPPPPPMREPAKEWESQDSQDGTAVPSTAQTDRSSKRWSLFSRADSFKDKRRGKDGDDRRHMTTIKSEGPRTELKSMFEETESKEFIPGIIR